MTDATPPLADTTSSKRAKTAPVATDSPDELISPEESGTTNDTIDDVSAEESATATAADTTSSAPIDSSDTDAHAAGDTTDSALTEGVPDPSIKSTDGSPAADETQPDAAAVASSPDSYGPDNPEPQPTNPDGSLILPPADADVDPTASTDPSSETPSPDAGTSTTDGGTDSSPATFSADPGSTDGVDGTVTAAQPVPGAAYGSGDPVSDPGSPVLGSGSDGEPILADDAPDQDDTAVLTDESIRDEAGTGADAAEVYFGEDADLPSAPDPEADGAVAGQPTSTFPQAADPAVIRQPANGLPANAYIPPGYRPGGNPIVDTPTTDDLKGGAGTQIVGGDVEKDGAFGPTSDGTEPLGEEKRTARIHELEDEKRDQVNASTLDADAGDTAAPQGDIDDPQPVGTEFDVFEVQKVTSYSEFVAEMAVAISFIELAAFNNVVNQRYELFPGDKVRVPKPNQPSRLDGVEYDGEE